MSDSQEKNIREQRRSESAQRKRSAADEETRKAQAFRRNSIIVIVCIVLIVAASVVVNSNLFYRSLTAVTIGNTKYSAAEVDVFYRNTYNTVYSGLGDYASYFVDNSTPLTQQQYYGDSEQTWAEYLYGQTLDNMREVTALYDAAVAGGYTLTDEDRASLDNQVASLELYASMSGFSSADRYLVAYYGKGVNESIYRGVLEKMLIAQNWSQQILDGFHYTQDELDAYYDEHADELDVISYYSYTVNSSDEAFSSLDGAEAQLSAARETAWSFLEAEDAGGFAALVEDFSGSELSETHYSGSTVSSFSTGAAEWLLDSARQSGDKTVIESDTGAAAFWFTGRSSNDYRRANMRHILIATEADENGAYTEEAWAVAQAEIDRIAADWETNPTEDYFAELANEYSTDEGSNTNGGLYEDITRYQMVPAIDDFLFAQGTQPGETSRIRVESSNYAGWHFVYYIGENEDTYRNELADSALRNDAYTAYADGITASYAVTEGSGSRYVRVE